MAEKQEEWLNHEGYLILKREEAKKKKEKKNKKEENDKLREYIKNEK